MKRVLPLMVLLLIVALAGLGIAYGLWAEWLYIEGTVETGNVDVELSIEDYGENDWNKEVGTCLPTLLPYGGEDNGLLQIAVGNAYPYYECWVTFDVHSLGTIPVHIYQPDFGAIPPELIVELQNCYADDTQLHQSDEAYCTIWIQVQQIADEGAMYQFAAGVEARQFNEPRP